MNKVAVEELSNKTKTVTRSKQFQKLVKIRNSIRYSLSLLVIVIHGFFIGGIAFYNEWFAQPYSENSIIPNGIYFAVLSILMMLLLEFVYIYSSDNKLNKLQEKVVTEVLEHE